MRAGGLGGERHEFTYFPNKLSTYQRLNKDVNRLTGSPDSYVCCTTEQSPRVAQQALYSIYEYNQRLAQPGFQLGFFRGVWVYSRYQGEYHDPCYLFYNTLFFSESWFRFYRTSWTHLVSFCLSNMICFIVFSVSCICKRSDWHYLCRVTVYYSWLGDALQLSLSFCINLLQHQYLFVFLCRLQPQPEPP